MALTQVQPGMLGTPQPYNFKNRIINGACVIDQRNNGAAVSALSSGVYPIDRFQVYCTTTGLTGTAQQVSTAPTGFVNSLKFTTGTGATSGSTERAQIQQVIEGYNTADLQWGTVNAKTVTLSFWAQSSKTGQFGGSVQNYASDRSYPFSYTISAANTWTQVSITIPGDQSGTWLTTNSGGICLNFDLGMGSTLLGTANAWAATNYRGATGDTSVVATSGATFYITGVQLEVGVSATTFDYRPYTTELQLCQRYANSTFPIGTAWGTAKGRAGDLEYLSSGTSSRIFVNYVFPVTMRDTPTPTYYNPTNNNTNFYSWSTGSDSSAAGSFGNTSSKGQMIVSASNAAATDNTYGIHASFTSEL